MDTYHIGVTIWLYGVSVICLACTLILAWRHYGQRVNGYIILICLLAGLLLPTTSHDYKLVMLTVGMSIFIALYKWCGNRKSFAGCCEIALLFLLLAAYSSTLFSFSNFLVYSGRWVLLFSNKCPALLLMVLCLAGLMIIKAKTGNIIKRETQ